MRCEIDAAMEAGLRRPQIRACLPFGSRDCPVIPVNPAANPRRDELLGGPMHARIRLSRSVACPAHVGTLRLLRPRQWEGTRKERGAELG